MKKFLCVLILTSCSAWAKYTNESELSSIVTGGNSEVETYLVKTDNRLAFDIYSYNLNGHYTYGEANNEVSARDWHINPKIERKISQSFAVYVGELVEGYRFQGIKARYNSDAGLKYYFIKSDDMNIFSEAGYRYTIEDRYTPEENVYENKGRLYGEINQQPNKNFSYRYWLEYLPNFTNAKDYILTHEASITSILTNTFSLKFSYRGIYDDLPAIPGNKNYDYTYMTSLVAKF